MDIAVSYGGAYDGRLVLLDSNKAFLMGINAHNETQYFTTLNQTLINYKLSNSRPICRS